MRYLLFIVLVWISASCIELEKNKSDKSNVENREKALEEKFSESEGFPFLSFDDLKSRVFKTGAPRHLTDSCEFYFACDCCAGHLIFNDDSTFYRLDYCMSDENLTFGTYILNGAYVELSYSGRCVSKDYNWANETDTSEVDFFFKDTVLSPTNVTYEYNMCATHIKFVHGRLKEVALIDTVNYLRIIDGLVEEGLLYD